MQNADLLILDVTGYRYMIHFYCLAVEAGFYSDVVECLPVDPATWVRFPAGTGKIFSLYDNGAPRWAPICRRVWIRFARDLNDRCCYRFILHM